MTDSGELHSLLQDIGVNASRLANREMAGQHKSVFKGRGMSFEEVRPYQQGDDVRVIDWNVSARTGDLYVKVFVEERELTFFLLLDMSPTSQFGTLSRTRRRLVAEVAAIHAFSAIKNSDRVGLIIFTDRVEHFVPPKKGKTHVMRVIRDILSFDAAGVAASHRDYKPHCGIGEAVKYMMKVTKKTSVAFLFSDFIVSDAEMEEMKRPLSVAQRRHDIVAYVARDPVDEELPAAGLVTVKDLESSNHRLLDSGNPSVRTEFHRLAVAQRARVETLLKKLSIDSELLWTNEDYVPKLIRLMKKRARRY
jgi:uncharacterized protein (DUF58 family)